LLCRNSKILLFKITVVSFRGFIARETVEKMREDELIFLGMKRIGEDPKDPNSTKFKYEQNRDRRKDLQDKYEKDLEKAKEDLKDQIKKHEQNDIKETLLEERRQWIRDYIERFEKNQLPKSYKEFYKWKDVAKPLTPEEEEALRKEEEDKKKEAKKKKDAKKAGGGKKKKTETPVRKCPSCLIVS
jgi:hypothetical protein